MGTRTLRGGYGLAKEFSNAMEVGPMTLGLRHSAHVVDRTIRVRGLLNMIAMAVVEAQDLGGAKPTPPSPLRLNCPTSCPSNRSLSACPRNCLHSVSAPYTALKQPPVRLVE